jgi:hypothetical protein
VRGHEIADTSKCWDLKQETSASAAESPLNPSSDGEKCFACRLTSVRALRQSEIKAVGAGQMSAKRLFGLVGVSALDAFENCCVFGQG